MNREFYEMVPVTSISFVIHAVKDGKKIKKVFTYISKCLSHTTSFVLKCLEKLLQ
jgi:hypothetical protein